VGYVEPVGAAGALSAESDSKCGQRHGWLGRDRNQTWLAFPASCASEHRRICRSLAVPYSGPILYRGTMMLSSLARQLVQENNEAKQRILDVAELLFTERGLQVSVRDITAKAKVSLAGINYYFGSKGGLTQAVFERLSQRVNERRLVELDAILKAASSKKKRPSLFDLVSAFVRPYLDGKDNGRLLAKIILQHHLEPSPLTHLVIDRHFEPMATRFLEAFALACPNVSPRTFAWRYSFMISAIVLTLVNWGEDALVEKVSKGRVTARNLKTLSDELTLFLAGALSAPSEPR
jgi:AcrR family transcriptional regulator